MVIGDRAVKRNLSKVNEDILLDEQREQAEELPVNRFVGTHLKDIEKKRCRVKLPPKYRYLLKISGTYGFLAGGAVRYLLMKNVKIKSDDFDFYAYTPEGRAALHERFIDAGFRDVSVNVNAWNLKKGNTKIQIIKSFAGPIERVIDEFDFTICRVATDGKFIYRDKDFYRHCRKKLLVLKTIQCPVGAIRRLVKYSKKGFWISNLQIVRLYEDYVNRGDIYRQKLTSFLEKQAENGKLDQREFEELEAILIKID